MQAAPTEEENGLPDIMTRTRCLIALLFCSSLGAAHEFSGAHGTVEIEWSLPNVSRILSSGYGDSFGADVWTRKGFPEPVEGWSMSLLDIAFLNCSARFGLLKIRLLLC